MSNMKEREKSFEAKFALDEEQRFRAIVRRNRLLGSWAAELMGRADAEAYAQSVVEADFEEAGDDDVLRKVAGDLTSAGVAVSEEEIRAKMLEFMAQAAMQVQQG
ncbi:DUF1476 domain-containing protein [Rhizobium sp. SL86]|uniref:DUF1476 domain-containing protein n=1 Tax=Rhizobium sp. SL86 TaxID=2995148 RepID=UPI0022767961|nr:DUF1476 domain-containing protein [Rhizobium sp. SL86]MCY1668836.1 DUF1476 domain-containing protein [Rhizobium sp. SL86]